MSSDDLLAALPFVVLAGAAAVVLVLGRWVRAEERAWMLLGAIAATASLAAAGLLGGGPDGLGGLLRRDGASALVTVLVGASAVATLLLEAGDRAYEARRGAPACALILLASSGAVLMAAAGDLVVMLAGLGLLLVPLHALAASRAGGRGRAWLGALRRGAIAPVLAALGIALVYADVGSTRVGALGGGPTAIGQSGIALIVAALAVAAAFVPFHLLAAELDATAPAPVVGFIAIVAKLGAFAALLRVGGTITASGLSDADWRASIAVLGAVTMGVGALVAVARSSLRSLLVFLCVAQGGTLATALASGVAAGPAIGFGLAVLAMLTIGAFAVVAELEGHDPRIDELRGLARRRPLLASAFGVLMLGLAGLPPTGGFLAKAYLFEAAIGAQLAWLVIVGVLTMVLCAACSFRVVLACLGEGHAPRGGVWGVGGLVAVAAAVAVLAVGVFPGPLLEAVQSARF